MDIKFLGTGGVFDYKYGNSSMTVDLDDRILVDCGSTVFERLCELDIIDTIDYLLLTHLHGDHVGSLFQLIFFFRARLKKKLKIIATTPEFQTEIVALLECLGVPNTHYEFVPVSELSRLKHIDTTGKHSPGLTSFAYVFADKNETLYYSGDLGDVGVTRDFIDQYDGNDLTIFHEMHYINGPSHVHYTELAEFLGKCPLYAYHVNPEKVPSDNQVPLVFDQKHYLW